MHHSTDLKDDWILYRLGLQYLVTGEVASLLDPSS